MNSNSELTTYMNGAIERLVANTLKSTFKNPRETAFLMDYFKVIKKANKKRIEMEERGTHIPAFLISSITNNCNLYCKGCYARENKICGDFDKKQLMTDKKWLDIFLEAADLGVAFNLLAGGEPLMRKDVIEQAAKVKDMIFPIFTNGLLMNKDYLKLFSNHRNLIPVISIEGSKLITDNRRGTGTYERICKVMLELQKIKVLYGTSITVTSENLKEVTGTEFIKSLSDKGCRLVFFIEYVPVADGTEYLSLAEEDRNDLANRQEQLRREYEEVIFLSFPGDEKYMGGCLAAGRGFFHINPYGGAEPCPFSPYSDCNLTDSNLLEAMKSPLFHKLNETKLVGGEHTGGCALFAHKKEVETIVVQDK